MSQNLVREPASPAPADKLETRIVRKAIQHPRWTIAIAALFVILCVAVITRIRIDAEILNLLPQRFDSVRSLKVFDREFSQAREITFALWDENGGLDDITEAFGDALRQEPWVVRVMDRSPVEHPEGMGEIQKLAVPLLFNLPPEEFTAAVRHLAPEAIANRLKQKRAEIAAGSIKGEMEMKLDPLGVVLPALKPLASSFNLEDSPRPLGAEDGTLRVVVAVTTQEKFDEVACQETMAKVDAFRTRFLAQWKADGNENTPEILATGRIAYVAEMSALVKHDIISTVAGSVLLVGSVFYLGFRRLKPLLAIFHVLVLCCLGAVAAGTLIFGTLNAITMGICAIMIGMGVDFGMLLYGTYRANLNRGLPHVEAATGSVTLLGRGILFGASTAGASFMSLALSESPGFAQLGVLIGIGVLLAACFMICFFFAFLGSKTKSDPPAPSNHSFSVLGYIHLLARHARPVVLTAGAILIGLNVFAYSPLGTIIFHSDPKTLEPAGSKAGFTLRKIMEKMPRAQEPVLALVTADTAEAFHEQWTKAQQKWVAAKESGAIKNVTAPAAFALSPARIQSNLGQLQGLDVQAARAAFAEALEREGFAEAAFQPSFEFLAALETMKTGDRTPLDWRKTLPLGSSWIFVLDRFLSSTPNVGVAYITPNKTIANAEEQQAIANALLGPDIDAHLTGWSYVIADLLPWSKGKLTTLSILMVLFITSILAFVYRSFKPLAVLMVSLTLSIGAMIAGVKMTGIPLNLFNILAFPLVLGIGVDYGIYTILAVRQRSGPEALAAVVKPILMSGLTTIAGFGSLGFANNPALSSLGLLCALGVGSCLTATLFLILPAYLWKGYR